MVMTPGLGAFARYRRVRRFGASARLERFHSPQQVRRLRKPFASERFSPLGMTNLPDILFPPFETRPSPTLSAGSGWGSQLE
jgi:hypothetical protein